jgi:hypothetical protein
MTVINQTELAQLSRLDQVLMWSIMSINASNLDSRNNYISDNAAIRAESKDYITWQVVQDDKGAGKFTFSALLPIVNPHPLQDKVSILSRVWSYSPFNPSMLTESGISGYGWAFQTMPVWIDTTEKILAYCAVLGSQISKLAPLVRGTEAFIGSIRSDYWANCQYQISDSAYGSEMVISGYLTLDWRKYLDGQSLIRCLNPYSSHASNINCNFPDLRELWAATHVDLLLPVERLILLVPTGLYGLPKDGSIGAEIIGEDNSAEALIDSYGQSHFFENPVPDWYKDAMEYDPSTQSYGGTGGSVSPADSKAPKIIESLPICKEQDPAVVSYGKSPLASVLGK